MIDHQALAIHHFAYLAEYLAGNVSNINFNCSYVAQAEMIKEFEAGALTKLVKFLAARLENGKTWLVGNKVSKSRWLALRGGGDGDRPA